LTSGGVAVKEVQVFRAVHHGRVRQIGLSADQVRRLCPESAGPGWTIGAVTATVGEATGVVHRWPSGRDHVHWRCPLCGGNHISDFDPHADSNPVLWFCEAGDGGMCLVHWVRNPA
jgi:hypothetical protein